VFDDSKKHYAFNTTDEERIVLIVDLMRPSHIPIGTAVGEHTPELDAFISRFR
jgi:aspartyl/asparaginyl beta-hydroxylase (cupin superfamily)